MTTREIVKQRKERLKQNFKKISIAVSALAFIGSSMALAYFVIEKMNYEEVSATVNRINAKIDEEGESEGGLFNVYKNANTETITKIQVNGKEVPWLKLSGNSENLKTSISIEQQLINKKILDEAFNDKFPASKLDNPIGTINDWYLLERGGQSVSSVLDKLSSKDVFSKELFESTITNSVDETILEKFTNTGVGSLNSLEEKEQPLTAGVTDLQATFNQYSERTQINAWLVTKAWNDYSYTKSVVDGMLPLDENPIDNTFIARVIDDIDSPIFTSIKITPTKSYIDSEITTLRAKNYDDETKRQRIINKVNELNSALRFTQLLYKIKRIKDRMIDIRFNYNKSSHSINCSSGFSYFTLKDWLNKFVRSGDALYTDEDINLIKQNGQYFKLRWSYHWNSFNGGFFIGSFPSRNVNDSENHWVTSGSLSGCGNYVNYHGQLNTTWISKLSYTDPGGTYAGATVTMAIRYKSDGSIAFYNAKDYRNIFLSGYYKKSYLDIKWTDISRDFNISRL